MLQMIKQINVCFTAFLSPFFPGREEGVDFWPAGGDSTPLLLTFFFCYFESRALCCLVVIVYHRFCKRCADVWEERTQSFVSLSNIVCRCEGIQTLLLLTLFVFPTTNVFCLWSVRIFMLTFDTLLVGPACFFVQAVKYFQNIETQLRCQSSCITHFSFHPIWIIKWSLWEKSISHLWSC